MDLDLGLFWKDKTISLITVEIWYGKLIFFQVRKKSGNLKIMATAIFRKYIYSFQKEGVLFGEIAHACVSPFLLGVTLK